MKRRYGARALALVAAGGLLLVAAPPVQAAGTAPQRTWNFDQVKVPGARADGRSGSGVTVAVLDSWVDAAHMDFEGRVLAGADCVGGTCKNGPATKDSCDHGTHVAGTVASSSFGVAPKARILPVRVLTYDADTTTCIGEPADVAAGIRWAVGRGAKVINLSLGPDVPGLSASQTIPTAVADAAKAGVVVIFSAGNNGQPITDSYNGNALIIAATGRSGALASYSQRGTGVDLAAPGGDPETKDLCAQSDCVTSLFPGDRYAVAAGTSMAAPHVAGIAALLLGQNPSRGRTDVFDRLRNTARPLSGAGSGLVDASAALGVQPGAATPPASASPKPAPVVQSNNKPPRTVPKAVVPAPRRSTAPPTLIAAPAPSPVVVPPVAVAVSPVPPAARPPQAAPPRAADNDDDAVPLPLSLVAGALVLAAAASVAVTWRRTPARS